MLWLRRWAIPLKKEAEAALRLCRRCYRRACKEGKSSLLVSEHLRHLVRPGERVGRNP